MKIFSVNANHKLSRLSCTSASASSSDCVHLLEGAFILKEPTGAREAQFPPFLLTMGDVPCEELEDLVHFSVRDLPARGYVVMEEIRRQGKLCDVTLKVSGAGGGRWRVSGARGS